MERETSRAGTAWVNVMKNKLQEIEQKVGSDEMDSIMLRFVKRNEAQIRLDWPDCPLLDLLEEEPWKN